MNSENFVFGKVQKEAKFAFTEVQKVEHALKNHYLAKFHYPKILLLAIVVGLAVFVSQNDQFISFSASLGTLSYLGAFIGGIFFSFGFTSPFAGAFFVDLVTENIFLAAIIGGFGALLGDLLIFKIIRFSFKDEFNRIKREKLLKELEIVAQHTLGKRIMKYVVFSLAGFVIACPILPDEAGVSLIAGLSHIKESQLAIISFICNTAGILFLLWI